MAFADTPASSEAPNFPYANWMNLAPHNPKTKLKDFCLPGTHDSATATLQKVWTDERDEDWRMIFPQIGSELPAAAAKHLWQALHGCARATRCDIKTQLLMGVRAFDFRVWPEKVETFREHAFDLMVFQPTMFTTRFGGEFYSVHRFLGEKYSTIVGQLRDFLESYKGEVVYARFRFLDEKRLIRDAGEINRFFSWLVEEKQLRKYCIKRSEGNPFQASYETLVDGYDHSRLVIHFYDEPWRHADVSKCPGRDLFFTNGEIGLHGDTVGNGETVDTMVAKQKEYLKYAKDNKLLFGLWFVSCPPSAKFTKEGTKAFEGQPFDDEVLRTWARPFNEKLHFILQDQFYGEPASAIFVDWIEDTQLVLWAINRSVYRPSAAEVAKHYRELEHREKRESARRRNRPRSVRPS